ncbi:ELMO/CED-12 family-domain-containing protein [Ochromonadaceae sp. CCMP2298]|nr:ELMO/CED-12 family-domain-containing protein [Ochromonadaceae sp. CCMP2298]KAJ1437232.1 ELMO/CED-12 family-domain-containing protein [Ochromonadaceae sp. CCMP2298]
MEFLTSVYNSVSSLAFCTEDEGDLPSEAVLLIVAGLRRKLNTSYSDESHELLLREVYQAGNLGERSGSEFERVSTAYKHLGFQREDPISDLRGGGILSLENIHYILKQQNGLAMDVIARRSNREAGSNYPWAAGGVNVTRMVAALFEVISASGAPMGAHSKKKYWHLLEEGAFERLYVCAFVLLDKTFEQEQADYMRFPAVLALTKERFEQMLGSAQTVADVEAELGVAPAPAPAL